MEYSKALRVFNAYMYMEYIIKVPLDFKWTDQHLCVSGFKPV